MPFTLYLSYVLLRGCNNVININKIRWAITLWVTGNILAFAGVILLYFRITEKLFLVPIFAGFYVFSAIYYGKAAECPHCGKVISTRILLNASKEPTSCPKCNNTISARGSR